MKYVQMLCHEIGPDCNLKNAHARCPINVDRYERLPKRDLLSDEKIIEDVSLAYYSYGFQGMLTWQYYNEPLLYFDRLERLLEQIYQYVPEAQSLLWTNGTMIGNGIDLERLDIFDKVVISNYEKRNWDDLKQIVPDVRMVSGRLDSRLTPGRKTRRRCFKPYQELIIDAYGNWRLCCGDYLGTAVNLNVFTDGFEAVVAEYQAMRNIIVQEPQSSNVPSICKCCTVAGRRSLYNLVVEPFDEAKYFFLEKGFTLTEEAYRIYT